MYYCGLQKFINTCIEKGALFPFLCLFSTNIQPPLLPIGSKFDWMHFCYYQCLLPSICYQSCYINTFQTTLQLTLLILHMNEEVIWLRALTTHKSPSDTTQPKTRVSRYFPEMLLPPPWLGKIAFHASLLLINSSSVWKAHPVGRIHKADNELSRCLGWRLFVILLLVLNVVFLCFKHLG